MGIAAPLPGDVAAVVVGPEAGERMATLDEVVWW
jgi:hypothetical protein